MDLIEKFTKDLLDHADLESLLPIKLFVGEYLFDVFRAEWGTYYAMLHHDDPTKRKSNPEQGADSAKQAILDMRSNP